MFLRIWVSPQVSSKSILFFNHPFFWGPLFFEQHPFKHHLLVLVGVIIPVLVDDGDDSSVDAVLVVVVVVQESVLQ